MEGALSPPAEKLPRGRRRASWPGRTHLRGPGPRAPTPGAETRRSERAGHPHHARAPGAATQRSARTQLTKGRGTPSRPPSLGEEKLAAPATALALDAWAAFCSENRSPQGPVLATSAKGTVTGKLPGTSGWICFRSRAGYQGRPTRLPLQLSVSSACRAPRGRPQRETEQGGGPGTGSQGRLCWPAHTREACSEERPRGGDLAWHFPSPAPHGAEGTKSPGDIWWGWPGPQSLAPGAPPREHSPVPSFGLRGAT